ncbi:hypothetical protein [Castellaniella sp.]|uniref:hypothetical protein n=1 Tax=Castellaniella sp. TaxID=1955812 RepID=UPI002AFE2775|nr:hypothetical protein [Castellaniella sp.]
MQYPIPQAFDAAHYLAQNPDVYAAGLNTPAAAWQHYINYGAAESLQGATSRAPAPWFDAVWYLAQNPDLAMAGLSPPDLFIHYLTWGMAEGRSPQPNRLTIQSDTLTGTDRDEVFHAPIVQVDATHTSTLQLGDRIDGGAGTDTLIADLAGGTIAPQLTGIEHLQLSAYYPTTVLAAHIQGLADLTITQSLAPLTIQQLPDLVDVHLNNLVSVKDPAGQPNHITLGYQPQALDGRAVQHLSLDNVWLKPGGAQLYFNTHGPASLNILDISVSGVSALGGIAGAPGPGFGGQPSTVLDGLHTVRVDAQAAVDLGVLAAPHLKLLDASASLAGVAVDLSLVKTASLAIHGGAGDDAYAISIQQPIHLSTGGGRDTLVLKGLGTPVLDAPVVLYGQHTSASVDVALAARHGASDPLLVYWQDATGQVCLGLDGDGSQGSSGIQLLAVIGDLSLSDIAGGLSLIY